MAQDNTEKQEENNDGLIGRALVEESQKEEGNTAQQVDRDLKSYGATTSAEEHQDNTQEDEMVTESINVIKGASAKTTEETGKEATPEKVKDKEPDHANAEKDTSKTSEPESKEPQDTEDTEPETKEDAEKKHPETSSPVQEEEVDDEKQEGTQHVTTSENSSTSEDVKSATDTTEKEETSEKATDEQLNPKADTTPQTTPGESADHASAKANQSEEPTLGTSITADEVPQSKPQEVDKNSAGQATSEEDEDFAEAEQDEESETSDDVDSALTEDSEDETAAERHDIPKKEYDKMGKEALIKEFRYLLNKYKVQAVKEHIDEIRTAFISQFEEEQEEAKERFLEDGGNIIDFRYYSPLKKDFNTLYFEYRDKRNAYFKSLKQDLNVNLDVRNSLIDELKELKEELGGEDSINTTFDKFRDIQERWRSAGNIPRDRYNLVWNNYHHHVENFYDFLHLNREFRDRDFKDNLDKKMKLVEQAEELTKAQDINRAFKELQMLHKIWKEEIGPVAREYREDIWDKFSAATRSIHDSRQEYFKNIDKVHEENLTKKQEVVKEIEAIAAKGEHSHGAWQNAMKKVEALRDEFFKIGKVPRKKNETTWKAFKKATRDFNRNKNGFYKGQKKEQQENLSKKMELVKLAEDNRNNEDLETTIELVKKIQADWKKIGHVPRRDSDKIWKRFKQACNHVFDRLHADKKDALEEEQNNLKVKQEMLQKAKSLELTGKREEDLATIKSLVNDWKETGRVPFSQKGIEKDFNKILDGMFKKLDLGRKETEMIKYDNRVAAMADRDDERQIEKEHYFISKKIGEVTAEINQLENNLGFFQHVPDDNPMVQEVHKNINNHKKTLEIWKAKMKKIKEII